MFENSKQIVTYLKDKFGENISPAYHIIEILESCLMEERDARRRNNFKTIVGSSEFHIAIFTPNADHFKASPRLCMCDRCMVTFGSCALFKAYELQVKTLNTPSLRSDVPPPLETISKDDAVNEFVAVGTYVVVAANHLCYKCK